MNTFKHYVTELFQSFPNINTKNEWQIDKIKPYDSNPGVQPLEINYYTEIKTKEGKPVMYEFSAVVANPIPNKQLTKKERLGLGYTFSDNLPAAEVSFTTMNHPKYGTSLTMVGDADVPAVLNHAIAFIKDLIDTYKLNLITFSASSKKIIGGVPSDDEGKLYSDSREKVYERIIRRLADQLGFKYEKRNIKSTQYGHGLHASTDFILIRKR